MFSKKFCEMFEDIRRYLFYVANLQVKPKVDNILFYISALINLGYCIEQSGNFEKSANLLEEAVTLSRSFCSPSHPQLASGLK